MPEVTSVGVSFLGSNEFFSRVIKNQDDEPMIGLIQKLKYLNYGESRIKKTSIISPGIDFDYDRDVHSIEEIKSIIKDRRIGVLKRLKSFIKEKLLAENERKNEMDGRD